MNVTGSFISGFFATFTVMEDHWLRDRWHHQPLYESVVLRAREMHLAGATVLCGSMGFGKSSRLHTAKILRLSIDLPLVIEIVDAEEKIKQFLPALEGMIGGGLVTLEKMGVFEYRAETQGEQSEKPKPM